MYDVVYGDTGFVVAVGTGRDAGAIWHSGDGLAWDRVDLPISRSLSSVAHGDDGYVAVGSEVFVSSDGVTWRRAADASFEGDVSLTDVAYGNGVYMVVGAEHSVDAESAEADDPRGRLFKTAVWVSTDARTWTRATGGPLDRLQPAGAGLSPSSVVFGDGRFVIDGWATFWPDYPDGDRVEVGQVWIGESG